jgi:Ca2+-binding RTX toxin-like protein
VPTFNYSTITAAQALAITTGDTLVIDQGPANATTVFFVAGTGGASDTINLNVGATTVSFGVGLTNATISYADGSRLFVGTPGNDAPAVFPASSDGMYGGAGNDTLMGGDGTNQLQGNQGNDSLVGGAGRDVIYGGQDNDIIRTGASANAVGIQNFAQGNRGDDILIGSATDSDILLGGQGNDLIGASGAGQGQVIVPGYTFYFNPVGATGGGDDFIIGNLGNDIIFGGAGNDDLRGEDGDDFISDSGGRNLIDAGAGNDGIVAGGTSTVVAGVGNDIVLFNGGTFNVTLGDGDDITGSVATSGADACTLDGGAGNDAITATDGADSISGGLGDDAINSQGGADTMSGGSGVDIFQFQGAKNPTTFATLDIITDWSAEDRLSYFNGANASLPAATPSTYVEATVADYEAALAFANNQIAGGAINYAAVQVGGDVYVFCDSLGDNGTADTAVRLVGRSLADISATNIVRT